MDRRRMNYRNPSIQELRIASKVLRWLFEKHRRQIDIGDSPLRLRVVSDRIARVSSVNDDILNEISKRTERKIKIIGE